MFDEEKFAIFVLACIVIGIVFTIIHKKWRHKLPKSAYIGFGFQDIVFYYKSAIKIILKKRWLLWLPLCFVLSHYFITIPAVISQRASMASEGISLENINPFCQGLSSLECLDRISEPLIVKTSNALLYAMASLDYAYAEAYSSSFLFIILFLLCAAIVVFSKPTNKFLFCLRKNNPENYAFLGKIFKLALAVLVFFFVQIIVFELMEFDTPSTSFFEYPGLYIISLLGMSLLSIVQGLMLFTVNGFGKSKKTDYKSLFKDSLGIARSLFYLNLILYLVASISSLLMLPYVFKSTSFLLPFFSFPQSKIFTFISTLFAVLTYCTTFVLITQGGSLKNAFLLNFKFIAANLLKYIQFVFIASVLILLPGLISIITWFFTAPLSVASMLINIIILIIKIFIAVPIFIAFFLFFKDFSSKQNKKRNARARTKTKFVG